VRASPDSVQPFRIAERSPQAAVFPETPEQVAAVLRVAQEHGWGVVPWGTGRDLALGRAPTRYHVALSLSRLAAVLEHDVENLTLTAQAGLTLAQANRAVAKAHHWVPMGPVEDTRSLGGIVALNRPVPRRLVYGDLRDQVLGMVVATPDGRLVRYGRKVIKNVAGYDMSKLFTGSAGMLGVIVEVILKLSALPDESALAVARFPSALQALAAAGELYRSALAPAQLVLLDDPGARRCMGEGGDGPGLRWLGVAFEGRSMGVRRQTTDALAVMERHGATRGRVLAQWTPEAASWFETLSAQGDALLLRLGAAPTTLGTWAERLSGSAQPGIGPIPLVGDYAGGWLRAEVPLAGIRDLDEVVRRLQGLREQAEAERGYLLLEQAPAAVMEKLGPWGTLGGEVALMQVLRRQMDPREVLSPGRFL
jgi:glycolate oxidase FAD binding subunit